MNIQDELQVLETLDNILMPAGMYVCNGGNSYSCWSSKTSKEILKDIYIAVRKISEYLPEPINTFLDNIHLTLILPSNSIDHLAYTDEFGISVRQNLFKEYPNLHIKSSNKLNNCWAAHNAFYLYAEKIGQGEVFLKNDKYILEIKRPLVVLRYYGI